MIAIFFSFNFVEVVGEVAGEEAGWEGGAEFESFLDNGVEEIAIVGDDEEGSGVVDEGFLEDVLGLHIEVVGGFVEDEKVGGSNEHADESDTGAFAAGEDAYFFVDVVASEEEAAENVTG